MVMTAASIERLMRRACWGGERCAEAKFRRSSDQYFKMRRYMDEVTEIGRKRSGDRFPCSFGIRKRFESPNSEGIELLEEVGDRVRVS